MLFDRIIIVYRVMLLYLYMKCIVNLISKCVYLIVEVDRIKKLCVLCAMVVFVKLSFVVVVVVRSKGHSDRTFYENKKVPIRCQQLYSTLERAC